MKLFFKRLMDFDVLFHRFKIGSWDDQWFLLSSDTMVPDESNLKLFDTTDLTFFQDLILGKRPDQAGIFILLNTDGLILQLDRYPIVSFGLINNHVHIRNSYEYRISVPVFG